MAFTEQELTRILERLREGEVVTQTIGGGRYITTWRFADGRWWVDSFEEGTTFDRSYDEAQMRAQLRDAPEPLFLRLIAMRK